jgi:hypothetical protein
VKTPAPSQYLSLAAALEFAKGEINARSTLEARVWRPLYRALFEGVLVAIGDFEDREGRLRFEDKQILLADWRALRESDFVEACYRHRVLNLPNTVGVQGGPLFLINARIETRQLHNWLGLKTSRDDMGENSNRAKRQSGPKPTKLEATVRRMSAEIESGELDRERLDTMKEEEMASRYSVSRDTARKARQRVLDSWAAPAAVRETSTDRNK